MNPSRSIAKAGLDRLTRHVRHLPFVDVNLKDLPVFCWKRWKSSATRVSVLRHQLALAKVEEVALREEWLTTLHTAKRRR